MKENQDADTIIRELFIKALSTAKEQAKHSVELYKSILNINNLGVNARIILLRDELNKLISEIQHFNRPEYIYNFRNEKNLYNLFYNRLVFLEVNESEYIINAYEIAEKQAFLLNEYSTLINSLPSYSFSDFIEGKENVFLFRFNEKPKNIEESEFEKIRIWQSVELLKAIELEKHYFQQLFRNKASKSTNIQEVVKVERSYFDSLFSYNFDTNCIYFVDNLQNITPLKSASYTFTDPQKIKNDFLNFFNGNLNYELVTPSNILNIQSIYNQKKPVNPISETPFLFWSLLKYDDWLDDIQKGKISIEQDNNTDYKQISINITEKALQKAQIEIENFITSFRNNDRYTKQYSDDVLAQLDLKRHSLNSFENIVYYNLLDKPDLLQSVFIQNCYFSSEPEQHFNLLENSIIINEEIEFLISEMSKFVENQYFKIPENQRLTIHLEILGLINSITIDTALYKSVFSVMQQFLNESGTTRKPFYFCLLDLKDNLFRIFDNAIHNLQSAFDFLPQDRKHYYIQKRLKEIKLKEINLQRNNKELGYYIAEFKKVLEVEIDYIKDTKDYDFINKFLSAPEQQTNHTGLSFNYLGIDINKLEKIYFVLTNNLYFINETRTSKTDFIEVLTAKDLSRIKKEIHIGCETTQFAYILKRMEHLFKNFNPTTIEKSGLFFSKKGTKLTASNLYKSKIDNPKEEHIIDNLFKELK